MKVSTLGGWIRVKYVKTLCWKMGIGTEQHCAVWYKGMHS